MKIGILTASRTNNIGTDLQTFAMQRIFSEYGNDVEVINYKCRKLENSHRIFLPSLSIRAILLSPLRIYKNISHWAFRKKYIRFSDKVYDDKSINQIDYDKVVVGSDQIWNLRITGYDLSFFLPFSREGMKKYSYAASLGVMDLTQWQREYNINKYLEDFESVSVREESGVDALRRIGVSAQMNLDPLLMVPRVVWQSHAKRRARAEKYVFLYLVEYNEDAVAFAKRFAAENNATVYFYSNGLRPKKGMRSVRFCSVDRWLSFMNDADMIITNSYHGLSIAVSMRKNFRFVELSGREDGNARMKNLLTRLDLQEYTIDNGLLDPQKMPPWDCTDRKLAEYREKSIKYIQFICQ